MSNWIEKTKNNIQNLKKEGFYNNWKKEKRESITFFLYPNIKIPENWIEDRVCIYKKNANKLNVDVLRVKFYIYESIQVGKSLGIIPAVSFIKEREIHSHLNQSPGHELTHILIRELNSYNNLPAHGLWSEGICVYLDGTNTDRKKHTNSINLSKNLIKTSWNEWEDYLPGNFYPLAGSVIEFCDQKFGWNKILSFVKKINKFNKKEISEEEFGISYIELQKKWFNWLNN